jgi:hypothetical protein
MTTFTQAKMAAAAAGAATVGVFEGRVPLATWGGWKLAIGSVAEFRPPTRDDDGRVGEIVLADSGPYLSVYPVYP